MINVRIYSYKPLDSRLFPLVFGYQAVAQVLGSNFALWGCQIFCKPGWGVGAYSNMSWWMMMDDTGWWWMMDDDESLSPHLLTHASRTIVSCLFCFQLCATSINKMPHQNILGGYTGMEVPMHQAGNRSLKLCCCRGCCRWRRALNGHSAFLFPGTTPTRSREILTLEKTYILKKQTYIFHTVDGPNPACAAKTRLSLNEPCQLLQSNHPLNKTNPQKSQVTTYTPPKNENFFRCPFRKRFCPLETMIFWVPCSWIRVVFGSAVCIHVTYVGIAPKTRGLDVWLCE